MLLRSLPKKSRQILNCDAFNTFATCAVLVYDVTKWLRPRSCFCGFQASIYKNNNNKKQKKKQDEKSSEKLLCAFHRFHSCRFNSSVQFPVKAFV